MFLSLNEIIRKTSILQVNVQDNVNILIIIYRYIMFFDTKILMDFSFVNVY